MTETPNKCQLTDEEIKAYFSGDHLYGDDFDVKSIEQWFEAEREGYADLGARDQEDYSYSYHALNQVLGFRYLPTRQFKHAIGLGSAYGDEFMPIVDRLDQITIIEPSDELSRPNQLKGVNLEYIKPEISGQISMSDNSADLCLSLGVLHHIPNITTVVNECARCLEPGGYMIVKEPIVSMGDWRKPRRGLTANERGIPKAYLINMLGEAGFEIVAINCFNLFFVRRLSKLLKTGCYSSSWMTRFDVLISKLLGWNYRYHRTSLFSKFAPASIYVVAKKAG